MAARPLSAPRYRALFKSNCISAVGVAEDDLEEMCLYHLHFTPTPCQTPLCIMLNSIGFNGFIKK